MASFLDETIFLETFLEMKIYPREAVSDASALCMLSRWSSSLTLLHYSPLEALFHMWLDFKSKKLRPVPLELHGLSKNVALMKFILRKL